MKFRKKPVEVEAVQWNGANFEAIKEWSKGVVDFWHSTTGLLHIRTLEGVMTANRFDWIIRGIKGEYYPCKSDIFEATYERVE